MSGLLKETDLDQCPHSLAHLRVTFGKALVCLLVLQKVMTKPYLTLEQTECCHTWKIL